MDITDIINNIEDNVGKPKEDNKFIRTGNNDNFGIISLDGRDELLFYETAHELSNPENFSSFVKAVESMVRKDQRYKHVKNRLFENGFDRCAFYGNLNSDKVTIDMHHGPMFNLYEVVAIITDHFLTLNGKVCVEDIAEEVMQAHLQKKVQLTMLCETAHQLSHDGEIFVHFNNAFGDVNDFLRTYHKGILFEHLETLEKYTRLAREHGATDNNVLEACVQTEKLIERFMIENRED